MKISTLITAAALVSLATAGFAQTEPQTENKSAPGKVSRTSTVKTVSTVVGIEPDTRTIWLKDAKGKVIQVVASEDARNFEHIRIGDKVTAEYSEAITITLKKGGGPLDATENQALERAPTDSKPGGAARRQVTIMANVTAVNHQTGAVTLKGPQGNSVDMIVQDPDQLKLIRKGDQIEVLYSEAVAISVEPQTK